MVKASLPSSQNEAANRRACCKCRSSGLPAGLGRPPAAGVLGQTILHPLMQTLSCREQDSGPQVQLLVEVRAAEEAALASAGFCYTSAAGSRWLSGNKGLQPGAANWSHDPRNRAHMPAVGAVQWPSTPARLPVLCACFWGRTRVCCIRLQSPVATEPALQGHYQRDARVWKLSGRSSTP